ncbi:hypothetical protein HAX54_011336 [Datura stramonium]|uniref:Branched-chain-amino-acid aminotransferase n=1 Tax=Datura stramonium TaxID=4076 RepID=A0ABS8THU8_DATST|nr:hypothetical protein [Datura stramonium]
MESAAVFAGLHPNPGHHNHLLGPSRTAIKLLPPSIDRSHFVFPLKLQKQSHFTSYIDNSATNNGNTFHVVSPASNVTTELADIDWDNLGFGFMPTDYMYSMKCSQGENFSKGELQRFGNIELSPSAGILNYGQGLFEGLKAYRKHDGNILLFRPEENAMRLKMGAERMCMPSPSVEQFVEAVKATVLANERWHMGLPRGEVVNVEKLSVEGLAPINLVVETEMHRATPGERYLEEVSSCNVFIVKGNMIVTPAIKGTILPGITRKYNRVAISQGFQTASAASPDLSWSPCFLISASFLYRTAVVVSPVGSITHQGRVTYGNDGVGLVSQQLYTALTSLQMGLSEDKMGWIVELKGCNESPNTAYHQSRSVVSLKIAVGGPKSFK